MIDVYKAVCTVYILVELEHRLNTFQGMAKLRKPEEFEMCAHEVHEALKVESTNLARAFRDYITLTCFGEARHANQECEQCWKNEADHNSRRADAYESAHQYTPVSILTAAHALFDLPWKGNSYGGKKWQTIAKLGLTYDKHVKDNKLLLFLDRVVDLSHNSGLFLDKSVIFDCPDEHSYRTMLTQKTGNGLLDSDWTPKYWRYLPIHADAHKVAVHTMRQLGLDTTNIVLFSNPIWEEEFIQWGTTEFKPELIDSPNDDDEEPDDDDNEEESKEEESTSGKMGTTAVSMDEGPTERITQPSTKGPSVKKAVITTIPTAVPV